MKILIYGLGQGLDLVERKLKKEHEIIGYTDSYSNLAIFRNKPFYNLEKVSHIFFDYLVITITDKSIAWNIYNMLINKFKIYKKQIIPFFVYANYELYKYKMGNYDLKTIKTLIFGNSHAKCGFLEKEMKIPTVNLSISAQDIYYNYKVFQNCIYYWGDKLWNLKYIIIDLYDYCYFNWDTSKTKHAIDYVLWGGCLEEHNFKYNKNYNLEFKDELLKRSYLPDRSCELYPLFYDINAERDRLYPENRYHHIEKDTALGQGPFLGSIASKRNEITVMENMQYLKSFLTDIHKFNINIQIIFTLIPRYYAMEQTTKPFMEIWKKEFDIFISELCDKHGVIFWNYKEKETEISKNHMFYYDPEHLNTIGGRALSSVLNDDLKKLAY